MDADVPASWRDLALDGEAPADVDLLLEGSSRRGNRPRVTVRQRREAGDLEELVAATWRDVQRRYRSALLTSSDVWPHPVWGEGRLIQTARVERGATMAHDCYLFRSGRDVIRVEVDCPLADLLAIEDDIADIVAHLRAKES